jgi:prepilin-type N-terminal cleavage/methylation domain-containing protein
MQRYRRQRSHSVRRGFTLVELLVVIAIIGVLVAILLPAVQAAREAGRRTTCINNLRNIGLAWQNHLDVHKHYPTGGWGWLWAGDPDRGYGPRQPGGWMYNVLPYMEEQALHDLGKGLAEGSTQKKTFAKQAVQTPLAWATCPTRRSVELFPVTWSGIGTAPGINIQGPLTLAGGSSTTYWAARSDYSANASDRFNNEFYGGPGSYAAANTFGWRNTSCSQPLSTESRMCGVSYERSTVGIKEIKDGISKTYLVGEKYLNRMKYGTGSDAADNEFWNVGFDNDMYKTAEREPASDGMVLNSAGVPQDDPNRYGGAHDQAFHMVFGDATVRRIPYEIDLTVHRRMANRQDGLPVLVPQ